MNQPGNKPREGGEGDANQPGGKGKTDGEGDASQPGGKGKRDGDGQTDGQTRPKSDQGQADKPRTDGGEGDRTQGNGDRTESEGATGDCTGDVEGGKIQDPISAADSNPSKPVGKGGFESDAISLTGKGDKLGDAVKWLKPEPGKIDVVVHGGADGFYVLKDGGYVKVNHRALAAYIKKNGGAGQDIRLISCGTGDSPTAIAQHLSNKLGVRVTAPTDTVWVHPDGRLTVGKNPTAETGGWNVFEPGTRPEVGAKPRADGDGTTPDVNTTPGSRTDEGGGNTTRPPETDGTTPARTDEPDAPRAAGKDDDGSTIDPSKEPVPPPDLPPDMADLRKNLGGDAARQFDAMWAKAKAQGKTDGFSRAIEGMQKGKLSLDETLANQWQRANAAPKEPHGDAAGQLSSVREQGDAIQRRIDDARGKLPDAALDRIQDVLRSQMRPIDEASAGRVEATNDSRRRDQDQPAGDRRGASGRSRGERRHQHGAQIDHEGEVIDIDVESNGGKRWIEVKNKGPFGLGSSDWSNGGSGGKRGVKEQAELMVEAAKKNLVEGEVPEVVIDFRRGVSPEVADALAAMGVTVRGERVPDAGARDVNGGGGKDGDGEPPGPVSAGIGPRPTPDTGGSGAKVEDGDTPAVDTTPATDTRPAITPTTDGIRGRKVSREDFLDTQPTDGDLETAKQQAQAERGMNLDEQAASIATGTARSEREMLLAIQNGEMPRFIARVGPSSNFDRGTFANPNRPFSFAAEPADLRGASPAEAMSKVGWTRDWIEPNIGKEIVIVCLDTEVAVPNTAGGSSKIEMGRMEWPELKAMALADPKFAHDAEALGFDPADLPALFDLAAATPVKGTPVTGDAAQLARLRGLIDRSYGANELYTGMGATMAEHGTLGAREVMMRPNDTGLKLTDDNHRRTSLGIMTQAQFDALFPPVGGGGGGGAPVQRRATGQPSHDGAG